MTSASALRIRLRPRPAGRHNSRRAKSLPLPNWSRSRARRAGACGRTRCACGSTMKNLRHPPREALRLPDPPQAGLPNSARADPAARRRRYAASARASTITSAKARFMPLAPVGGWMCAESPARNSRPYCIGSVTKLRIGGDALLQHRAFGQRPRAAEPRMQFVPDALVRPVLDVVVGRALQIEPRQRRRAHGVEREAALGDRYRSVHLRAAATPTECRPSRTDSRGRRRRQRAGRNARPADAVKAVAAANEVAGELLVLAAMAVADFRRGAGDVVHADVRRPRTGSGRRRPAARSTRSFTTSC